jgi:hypothetical protein
MGLLPARLGMALAALTWGFGAFAAAAAPVNPAEKTKPISAADKLRRDLDQVITIEITDQPLHLAVNQLREQTNINFVLDKFSLLQMGLDPEMLPVSAKLKDVKLRSALRTVFGPYNLSYAIIGDTVLISTDEMAIYRQMRQRVNVDAESTEFATVIKQLSRETATNLVIDPRVAKEAQGKVTLQIEDVPLETAVRLMSEMVGLKPVKVGNTLFICSKTTAKDLREEEATPMPGMPPGGPGMPGGPGGPPVPGVLGPGLGGAGVAPGGFNPPVAPRGNVEVEKEERKVVPPPADPPVTPPPAPPKP